MAAEFETGFFVKQPAWHEQGIVLAEAPSVEKAYELSGLDWNVQKKNLIFRNEDGSYQSTEYNAIVRDADLRVLGQCKQQYVPYQNKWAFEWCEPLVETGWWTLEAAGSLRGGEYCWTLLKQDEKELIPNDILKQYLALIWNHTGTAANVITPTTIRVVCMNTLRAALGQGLGQKIHHNSDITARYQELQNFYSATTARFAKQEDYFSRLLDLNMPDIELEEMADALFPLADENEKSTRVVNNAERVNTRVKELMVDGKASGTLSLGIKNTGYGAYQAVSEFVEHEKGKGRIRDRGWHILYGDGAAVVGRMENYLHTVKGVAVAV